MTTGTGPLRVPFLTGAAGSRRATWLAVALLCSGCADAPRARRPWTGSVDTLAGGVIHVSNPETGIWADGAGWRLVEELRIGGLADDAPDVFGEVAAVGASPGGLIHVIDGHAQEVRVFAPTGEHVRTFGRRGAGPDEFANAYSLDWDADGRLWIADAGNNRYAVYDTAGTFLFHAVRAVPGVVFPWLGGFARDGRLHDVAASQAADGVSRFTFYRLGDDGAVEDALPPIEHRRSGPPLFSMTLFWLTPRVTFAFDERGYLWLANTGEYRIIQRTLQGDTVRIISRAHTKIPVSQAQRDSIARELQAGPPEGRNAPIPATRPAIERLFVDPDGFLYVRPFGSDASVDEGFDVFDPDGRFLGRLHSAVPLSMFPALPRFTAGRVYAITTDSLGVPYVVRALIEK